jgi:hypothetical protein
MLTSNEFVRMYELTHAALRRFVLFKDGNVIDQQAGTTADFALGNFGNYRVEAYLDSLPSPVKGQPWIISNPIYVTQSAAL